MRKYIVVAKDFSRMPTGRFYQDDFWNCAEMFRETFLSGNLVFYDEVIIDLNGTLGFGSNWLQEVFGNIAPSLKKKIKIVSDNDSLVYEIAEYLQVKPEALKYRK